MSVRIVRLGTVRRPPRGVPKAEFAKRDYYDVWLPLLSPSAELVAFGQEAKTDAAWRSFMRKFRTEIEKGTNFSVGCYCENEHHCHRSVLRELLKERGAIVVAER